MSTNILDTTRSDKQKNTPHISRPLLIAMVLSLASCVQVRLLTYPETFTWIGEEDVESSMQSMALSMSKLNTLIHADQSSTSYREDVLVELDNLEYIAASLSAQVPAADPDHPDIPVTNHLLIDEHMDDFLEDILRARIQAESEPANYFGVGKLTGSCTACHRLR